MTSAADNQASLSATKQALLKIRELKERLAAAEGKQHQPIAIVSAACRFPRHSDSPEAFWEALAAGNDEIGQVPSDRWDAKAYFDADPDAVGKMYTIRGAFLDRMDRMDAEFFGISPREASWVDPQQRLLMEVCWEALERAAWPLDRIGHETGVFVGWMHNDYQNECSDSLSHLNPYIATGSAGSFLCGRLSYQLGLEGPSMAMDTACSSSLVALHAACQSLSLGECDRAVVGGVSYMASPKTFVLTCKLRALSPHGHSRAFDASADGYVRGEGCGVVTLRRLADAQRDGDNILAVIRGSAVTHNGYSSGLTAPNPQAQQRAIAAALEQAGVAPADVDYLEAHGTGTELGDPIELRAAAAVLGQDRDPQHPLLVGSVKTNVGHLEAAAGMAGLIKTVLALEHGEIPRHLHFETPNPHIPWNEIPVQVVTQQTPWPEGGRRIAGVSAFGMSGTNAHVVLEAAPALTAQSANVPEEPTAAEQHLLVVSGKSDEAVQQLAERYRSWLDEHPAANLADVCHTAAVGRRHFEHRAALVVDSLSDAQTRLQDLANGKTMDGLLRGTANRKPKVAWQFTGQGSQYVGMARGLYETQPVFRAALNRCDQQVRQLRDESLLDVMFQDESRLNDTTWTQPALFALEMGLAELLCSWGLQPDVVLGHSLGQFPAACLAGMLSWEDGLRLICERGRLIGSLPAGGAMAAVFAKPPAVQEVVDSIGNLSVAAFNGAHTVISGVEKAVDAAMKACAQQQIRCRRLTTSHAFHSALMDPIADEFRAVAADVTFGPPHCPLACNVTGRLLGADEVVDADYWWRQLRQPVQFADSIHSVTDFGCDVILELGPQPILTGMAAGCLHSLSTALVACLQRDAEDERALLTALGKLYVHGVQADFEKLNGGSSRQRLQLPTYPFQREYFWGPPKPQAFQAEAGKKHPLLGAQRSLAGVSNETRWESQLAADNPRWLVDHQVLDDVVMPGACYVEMALSAAQTPTVLEDIAFEVPLRLAGPTSVQTVLRKRTDEPTLVEVYSTADPAGPWMRNFTATTLPVSQDRPAALNLAEIRQRCTKTVDAAEFYSDLQSLGLQYGKQFQTVREVQRSEDESLVELETAGDVRGCVVPPMLLDGALHSLAAFLEDAAGSLFLPIGIDRLTCWGLVEGRVVCHARLVDFEGELRTADLRLADAEGRVLVEIEGLKVRQVNRAALRQMAGSGPERLMYSVAWRPVNLDERNQSADRWLIVTDDRGDDYEILAALRKSGQRCVRLTVQLDAAAAEFSDDAAVVSADRLADWLELLDHYFPADDESRLNGVVWCTGRLAGMDESVHTTVETERVCTGMLTLLHALRERKIDRLDRGLQILTHAGVATTDNDPVTAHMSQFWGLGRVIASEHPVLQCRLIDVDDVSDLSALLDTLLCDSREGQIAIRSGQRFVARLTAAKPTIDSPEFNIDTDASYLITGGLGALGLQAARWLASHSAAHVVLVSRRAPDEAASEVIAEIEQQGTQVTVESVDMTSGDDVRRLVDSIAAAGPPLKGVIHAAGVLDDGMLNDQSWSRFETVLAPKKRGALLLDELTADMRLDLFVLYSSAASVLGSPGQANYATANAFLDGLAHQRARAGLPGLSVNWGPWYEGMAAAESVARGLAQQGITPLGAEEAHQILEQLLGDGAQQATVLDADWRRLRMRFGGTVPRMLEEVAGARFEHDGESVLLERIRAAAVADRPGLLLTHIQNELQQILSLGAPPEPDVGLATLGLDSLMGVELSNRLQQQMGADFAIPPTLAFDYPSVQALTDHLLGLIQNLPEPEESVAEVHIEKASQEIAIIGMSCRFPGAENLDEYWQLLLDGVDAVSELPADRWDIDKYYSPEREAGKMYTREGGFIPTIADFDAEFFGISTEEACWTDPQHRLLLEATWEALENAGIVPDAVTDPRVGVFVGIMSHDYGKLAGQDRAAMIKTFQGGGLAHSAGVGRVSYQFGFQGPSVAVDTASSSSLVAVSQAMRSLLDGECNLAIAGGVNAILEPTSTLLLCKSGMLSPDGRCKSFSAAADGFGRGEGCGLVVLKRQSDAERDGDHILATISGAAVAHNGFSGALTAPNGRSQERMIRDALVSAGVAPADVHYLEAHGTGTKFGDMIEIQAAAAALGPGRTPDKPLLVGSVKANIGHLESAGGVSGLIKLVLAMQHSIIPRQVHFDEPNPDIQWDRLPVRMVTEPTAWPDGELRVAAVTALGMSGTNAHLILRSSKSQAADEDEIETKPPRPFHLLPLSARSPETLQHVAQRLDSFLSETPEVDVADACYTAAVGRKHFEHRAALVINSIDQMHQLLGALRSDEESANLFTGQASRSTQIAWLFSDSIPWAVGVGRQLYETQPVFRAALDACDGALGDELPGSLIDAMLGQGANAEGDPRWSQPAHFALQMALDRLWRSWGIEPDVVLGIGWGHHAAACAAGVMPWESGLQLVVERGRLAAASTSGQSSEAADAFETFADTLDYFPADRPLICSLSGAEVPEHRLLGGSYWRRFATETSNVAAALQALADAKCDVVLELGARAASRESLHANWPTPAPQWLPSLVANVPETESLLQALAQFYVRGVTPDFTAFDKPWSREKIGLPTYPFQRQRYWITDLASDTAGNGAEHRAGRLLRFFGVR